MYRDFSERSKVQLLELVSQVENEKLSDFTDWIGDRWYDFESWIGKLNIKNYLNNVNLYHKKVIDKNNTTKEAINRIFSNVKFTDISYRIAFVSKNLQLVQWQRYIEDLSDIVSPGNGVFNTEYIEKKFAGRFLPTVNENTKAGDGDLKSILAFIAGINKNIGKYGENEGATLASSILSYLSTLSGIATSDNLSDIDVTSSILSLFGGSVGVESGIYKYFENTLHPYEVSKLDGKFGKAMLGLSIIASVAKAADTGIDVYKIFSDPNSTVYDKAAQLIKMGGAVFDVGGDVYIAQQAGSKALRFVNSASGSKAVNQILVTEQKLKYTTSAAASNKISNATTVLAIGSVVASTASSAIKRYGQVSADGEVDMGDVGSVGIHGSLSGINTVTSTLTFGVVNFDSEEVASDLENDADDFLEGDSWAAQYVKDQDNNAVARMGVSIGIGGYLVGKKVVNGVAGAAETVGSWVSTGWNTVTNFLGID